MKPEYGAVHILRQPREGGEGVWQKLTIADEGGGVRKMLTNMRLWVLRMWIERTIDSNLTVYVKHCLNYHIFRVLVCWTTGKDDKLKFGGVF